MYLNYFILNFTNIPGEVGVTYKSNEERNKWYVEKVHQSGTHVIKIMKTKIAKHIHDDPYLRVQV